MLGRSQQSTMAYTNHTIISEAMEKWPVDMFKSLLTKNIYDYRRD